MAIDPFKIHAPLLDGLPIAARLAFPYIQKLAPSRLTDNQIIKEVAKAGLDVLPQHAVQIIRGLRQSQSGREYVRTITEDYIPNPVQFAETETNTLRRYSYTILVEGSHVETGQTIKQYVTVSTHDLLTKSQAIDVAIGYVEGNAASYNISEPSYTVENIQRNPLMPIA